MLLYTNNTGITAIDGVYLDIDHLKQNTIIPSLP